MITVVTDSFFHIGESHKICEDFALAGTLMVGDLKVYYAIVCDGCSSARNTDEGARVLARSTLDVVEQFDWRTAPSPNLLGAVVFEVARSTAVKMKLPLEALTATLQLIVAWRAEEGPDLQYVHYCFGDGTFAHVAEMTEGKGPARVELQETACRTLEGEVDRPGCTYYLYDQFESCINSVDESQVFIRQATKVFSPECPEGARTETRRSILTRHAQFGRLAPGAAVMVASDGVGSFADCSGRCEKEVDVFEAGRPLVLFKTLHGPFLQRRWQMHRRQMLSSQWRHMDDLSMAGIANLGEGEPDA